jgi:hypothetical protein
MTADLSSFEDITDIPEAPPSYLAEVAETIRDDALVAAREKLSLSHPPGDTGRLLRHPGFLDYFKYELALRVADVLVALDEPLQAIYLYDPSANADGGIDHSTPPDATVYLLVLVVAHTGALEAWIAGLDDALTSCLRDLPSPSFARRLSVLNITQVPQEEARYCPRYRSLLASVFAPPIVIWHCER